MAERVAVHRHGKTVWITRHKRERVVLLPHVKNSAKLRVKHGHTATVSGWLGTYTGDALAGQTVQVRTAPDNGLEHFRTAARATTAANGTWSATLPAGPSRLVEAVYGGGPTTQASISGQVKLIVPAKIKLLSVAPRKVAWGGTVRLVGKLKGGYLPAGGALVRLRIGEGSAKTTYGVKEHVGGNGRFTTTYTFGLGDPSVHRVFWFQIASLPTGDYPYAPANSRRLSVIVGGHPAPAAATRHSIAMTARREIQPISWPIGRVRATLSNSDRRHPAAHAPAVRAGRRAARARPQAIAGDGPHAGQRST